MTTTMTRTTLNALRSIALFASAVVAGSATLHAQTAWDGGAGNTNYANNLNWAGDVIPGDGNNSGAVIGNGSTQTVVYSTATSYTSNGTGAANSLRVGTGTNGVGSLTLNGSAGTLTFGGNEFGNAAFIGTTGGTVATTGTVTVSAGTLSITGGSDTAINIGVSTGGLSGVKSGALIMNGGTVNVASRILMGANHVQTVGTLTISSGLLNMQATGSTDPGQIRFGVGTNTVNLDGGTVNLRGFHTSVASNTLSTIFFNGTTLRAGANIADLMNGTTANANYEIKNGGLIMDTNNFNVTINDALSDAASNNGLLRKEGNGTLTLSAANAYTGTTTVDAGTLVVNGSLAAGSAVSVGANGTLSGTGTINGATTIFGAHTPGNSPGIQTFASDLAYDGGNSTVQWELVGNTTTNAANPNAVYDQIIVGGDLDFTDATELDLIFNGTGSTVLWSNGFWGSNQTWTLYDVAGSTTGFLANFSLNPSAWLDSGSNSLASVRSGASFNVSQSGSDILINYVAVPEPATLAILAGGVIGLAVVLRRRLRR
jgi:autotransporter-associated beta strand protein